MSYLIKGAPFRYRGAVDVSDCVTSQDVMQKAGLDWNVAKCELVAKMPILSVNTKEDIDAGFIHGAEYYRECPNAYATYRTDYNIPLGIVKDKYTPVQNREAFSFFDGAIGKDSAIWQTAGYFGNGERIFVSAKLPNNILVNGDPVENYLVFTTSHDGSTGVKILFTPIRVICQNTLNAAIRTASNFVSFKHTKSIHSNIDIAKDILCICDKNAEYLSEQYNIMAKTAINDKKAIDVLGRLILSESEIEKLNITGHTVNQILYRDYNAIYDANISSKKVNTLNQIWTYYYEGVGQKEILGTAWGVYNAVTGYYSNVDNAEGTKRMDSLLYGDKSKKIQTIGDILIAA